MISVNVTGDFSEITERLKKMSENLSWVRKIIEKHANEGLDVLIENTPVDSGLTADSWSYKIEKEKNGYSVTYMNSNVVDNIPVPILIVYGHVTKDGGWVPANDFVTDNMNEVFRNLCMDVRSEVVNA